MISSDPKGLLEEWLGRQRSAVAMEAVGLVALLATETQEKAENCGPTRHGERLALSAANQLSLRAGFRATPTIESPTGRCKYFSARNKGTSQSNMRNCVSGTP